MGVGDVWVHFLGVGGKKEEIRGGGYIWQKNWGRGPLGHRTKLFEWFSNDWQPLEDLLTNF